MRRVSPQDERFWLHLLTEQLPIADRTRFDLNEPTIVAIKAGLALLKNKRVEALGLANKVETTMRDRARPDARMTARFVMAILAADAHLAVIVEEGDYMCTNSGVWRERSCLVKCDHGATRIPSILKKPQSTLLRRSRSEDKINTKPHGLIAMGFYIRPKLSFFRRSLAWKVNEALMNPDQFL